MIETPQGPEFESEQDPESGPTVTTSLSGFSVSPFLDAGWEVVSTSSGARGFNPLELDVIETSVSAGESIFEDLAAESVGSPQNWHGPTGSKPFSGGPEGALQKKQNRH